MRLFVAVDVGEAVRDEVARVTGLLDEAVNAVNTAPRITWVSRPAIHLTLRFLGEVADAEAPRLQALLSDPIPLDPFEVEWHGLGAFPSPHRPRTLWIGVGRGAAELGALELQLSGRLDHAQPADDAQPFRPHLTIGRVRTPGSGVDWPRLLRTINVRGVRSEVEHVTLYRSALSPRGPNYTELARAVLGGIKAQRRHGA